jgi:hypothetical protein
MTHGSNTALDEVTTSAGELQGGMYNADAIEANHNGAPTWNLKDKCPTEDDLGIYTPPRS